jgi:hypothetical protein
MEQASQVKRESFGARTAWQCPRNKAGLLRVAGSGRRSWTLKGNGRPSQGRPRYRSSGCGGRRTICGPTVVPPRRLRGRYGCLSNHSMRIADAPKETPRRANGGQGGIGETRPDVPRAGVRPSKMARRILERIAGCHPARLVRLVPAFYFSPSYIRAEICARLRIP